MSRAPCGRVEPPVIEHVHVYWPQAWPPRLYVCRCGAWSYRNERTKRVITIGEDE